MAEIPPKFAALDDAERHSESCTTVSKGSEVAVVNDVRNIPADLRETHRGKTAQPGDPTKYEQFLLYENPSHMSPLLVLTTTEDLGWPKNSKHVVCDGNFKYQPKRPFQFTELYTIHGFVAGEAFPLVPLPSS